MKIKALLMIQILSCGVFAAENYQALLEEIAKDRQILSSLDSEVNAVKILQTERTLQRIANYYDKEIKPLQEEEKLARAEEIRSLEQFLKKYPSHSRREAILLTLSELYFDIDLKRSEFFLTEFIRDFPNSLHADSGWYLLGMAQSYQDHQSAAEKTFKYFTDHFTQSSYLNEVQFRLAEIYFEQKSYSKVVETLRPLLKDKTSNFYIKSQYKYAWSEYLLKNYSAAIKEFATLLDFPDTRISLLSHESARYIALSLAEDSKDPYAAAQSYFQSNPGKSWERDVWISLGHVALKRDMTTQASKIFEHAVQLDPKNPDNIKLDSEILDLSPSTEFRRALISRYIAVPAGRQLVQRAALELAIEEHQMARAQKKPELYTQAAADYAFFIRTFPEYEQLDQVLFFYSEASFDGEQYLHSAEGYSQIRDWSWDTEFREKATINAVYAYAAEIKKQDPKYSLETIDLKNKNTRSGSLPAMFENYAASVDVLAKRYPENSEVPALLLQVAGIDLVYGKEKEADKRLGELVVSNPKSKQAYMAGQILLSESINAEKWEKAAELANQFQNLNVGNRASEFQEIASDAQFKEANQQYSLAQKPEDFGKIGDIYLGLLNKPLKPGTKDKILFNAAMAFERSGMYEKADGLFERLVVEFPKSDLIVSANLERGLYAEQRLLFSRAAILYAKIPDDPAISLRAAFDFRASREFAQAGKMFERFTLENPDAPETPDAYLKAANAYSLAHDRFAEQRVIAVYAKKYALKVARADFEKLEDSFQVYQKLRIDSKSSGEQARQLTAKTKKLAELQLGYEKITQVYQPSYWTVASIYQIGLLYEGLLASMLKAPCPADVAKMGESACDEYASLLEEKTIVLEKKATEAYELSIQKSQGIVGTKDIVLSAKGALYRIKPSEYLPAEALLATPILGLAGPDFGQKTLEQVKKESMARLSIQPFDIPARLAMARLFYIEENPWAAQVTLEDTLEKDPKSALAFLWLGHVLQAQKEYTEAIKAYEKAVDLDSSLAEGFDALGLLYLDQNDPSKALKNSEKAQKLIPENLQVLVHLGNCYEAMGEPQKALEKYALVLTKNPKQIEALLNSGLVALTLKDYEKAEKNLKESLGEIKNNNPLKDRVEGYLKMVSSRLQLEKQRHEKAS